MKTKFFLIASFIVILFFISCNSTDNTTTDTAALTTANSQILADSRIDASINDVSNIAEDQFSLKQTSTARGTEATHSSFLPACAVTAWTYTNGTFTGSIDFGTEGCTLQNGNVLKGKITLSFSGNFMTPEKTITYSFDNFYHNGIKIQGSKTIIKTIKTTDLYTPIHPVFTQSIDLTITFENGTVYTRTGTQTKEMISGDTNHDGDDDDDWEGRVFLVTGNHTTTLSTGGSWSCTIKTPLRYEMACKRAIPVSGTVLKVNNGVETLIDYGTGQCDNLATVTTNGVTTTIELKK
ncbi:hypothetical protein [Flavobacterium gilvum]|uniref:Lipoprotein n=1 Tax=Flavobacterium gilvum TaxID=1492737 RepID=A0AAC9N3Q1_9FLAO|nr:hypothetical protein [Flavobacterium gilvum]AOW09265.1 hypothetical protein EM308_06950 [Flavobacterium gilvum]KFC59506.1 hypothetical protein FEM08_16530 [Flavobacterium gilvum]